MKATDNLQSTVRETKHGRFFVEPVIGFFDVSTFNDLPFGNWTVKIVLSSSGSYHARPNVVVVNSQTKCVEHICGIGDSVDEALMDSIDLFMSEVHKQRLNKADGELEKSDFVWLNWQPYS